MGEYADMEIDRLIDGADRWWHDHRRLVSSTRRAKAVSKTCKACGERGLKWRQQPNGRWVLLKGQIPHQCKINEATILAEFDDLTEEDKK